jgi:hypothetical protein
MTLTKTETPLRWVPLLGDFEIASRALTFKGCEILLPPTPAPGGPPVEGQQPVPRALIGIVASDRFMSDGVLRAQVRFAAVTANTVCELVLFKDRDRRHFVAAGLGGGGFGFGIREFGPPNAPTVENPPNVWTTYKGDGPRAFLVAKREYNIEVSLLAGNLALKVDGVAVSNAYVDSLLGRPLQVGAFLINEDTIEMLDLEVVSQKPKVFISMQFDGAFDELYEHVIREVCDDFDVAPLNASEMIGPGVIMEDIVRELQTSRLVVADITPNNPNVYFEVGYARALGKPIVLLAQKGTKLPFDVAGFRVLFYENTIGGKARLDESLRRHIGEVLGDRRPG